MQDWNEVIDGETLDELREVLGDGIGEFMKQFYGQLDEYATGLPEAMASNDAEKAYHIVHSLASSCGFLGATKVVDVTRRLEGFVRSANLTDAAPLVAELEVNLAQMRIALAELGS